MNKLALSVIVTALLAAGSALAQSGPQNPAPSQAPSAQPLKDAPAPLVRQAQPPARQSQVDQLTTDDGTPIKINPKSKSAHGKF
jgi:hypothetical protein